MAMRLPSVSATQEPVGLPRRVAALFYDSLLLVAVLFAATALALAVSGGTLDGRTLVFRTYLLVVGMLFFGWFWTHGGQTLGMRAWKIRVERIDGEPLRWRHALLRLAVALGTLGVGLLWTAVDPERRAPYDRASGTRVVRT